VGLVRGRRGTGQGRERLEEKDMKEWRRNGWDAKGGRTFPCAMDGALDGVAVVVYDDPTRGVIVSSSTPLISP